MKGDEAARRAELAALIETGWTNTPFSRCSYCGEDWNDGIGHDHGQMDPDPPYGFILVHEDRGGTIKFDGEKAADAVLAYVADAVARPREWIGSASPRWNRRFVSTHARARPPGAAPAVTFTSARSVCRSCAPPCAASRRATTA